MNTPTQARSSQSLDNLQEMPACLRPNEIVQTRRQFKTPRTRSYYAALFWAKVKVGKPDECWPWQAAKDEHEYGKAWNGLRVTKASRIAWDFVIGVIPDGMNALHSCDNPPCVNPKHLFLGTQGENMDDKVFKGRAGGGSMVGSTNPSSKLTEAQVVEIKRDFTPGYGHTARMARKYEVSGAAIYQIVRGIKWRHVYDNN